MKHIAQHRPARTHNSRVGRLLAVAAAGGIATVGGLATASPASAAPSNVWDRVAECESGGDWSVSTGNGYHGGLQFSPSSWRAAGGDRYAAMPHQATRAEQIAAAQNLLRLQGPNAWPVCSKEAGLNRSNGGSAGAGVAKAASADAGVAKASRAAVREAPAAKSAANQVGLSRDAVRDVQSWVGQDRTGRWTNATTRALQDQVGAKVDGVVGPETVRKTERAVDAKLTGKSHFTPATLKALSAHAG